MNAVPAISTIALLLLALFGVWRYPWTLALFVCLFFVILVFSCAVAAKRADAYMWQFKRDE